MLRQRGLLTLRFFGSRSTSSVMASASEEKRKRGEEEEENDEEEEEKAKRSCSAFLQPLTRPLKRFFSTDTGAMRGECPPLWGREGVTYLPLWFP